MNRWTCRIDWDGDWVEFDLPSIWGQKEAEMFALAMMRTFRRGVYLRAPAQEQGWQQISNYEPMETA